MPVGVTTYFRIIARDALVDVYHDRYLGSEVHVSRAACPPVSIALFIFWVSLTNLFVQQQTFLI